MRPRVSPVNAEMWQWLGAAVLSVATAVGGWFVRGKQRVIANEGSALDLYQDARRLLGERVFQAVITATSGGLIKIRRLDQAAADGQFYPAASGLAASVSPGNLVLCVSVRGTMIVVIKIVTS